MSAPFDTEQKQYIEGFFTGLQQRGVAPFLGQNDKGQFTGDPAQAVEGTEESVYGTPVEDLCKEEQIKLARNGLDIWDTIISNADADQFPEPADVFRYKFFGLFHVKPAQDSFMLRCRIPGGRLLSHQMRGLSEMAQNMGGGYLDITTRANLQIRQILPKHTLGILMMLDELGLTSRGSGADNIRNVTATPTTGFDPNEYLDVLPYARAMHHYILNNRDLYGLPRKFNISFDSGGAISVCADTNDIGFYACRVGSGQEVPPGVYFRVQLCGITGHQQFATDCGLLVRPDQAIPLAAAMIRVFIENGNRTNRNQARLKYLVDNWGVEKFLASTQEKLTFPLTYFPINACEKRGATSQHGHIGIHPQKQAGLKYVGVVIPVGRLSSSQMHQLGLLAEEFGLGEVRLTVWQNLLIPHVKDCHIESVKSRLSEIGLAHATTSIEGGLVACTGSAGCKYAATQTKSQALELGRYLSQQLTLDSPINIHLTGCPHSCAQHYIGDIGLLGTKIKRGGSTVEGYHVVFGGGVDERQAIARQVFSGVAFDELKPLLEKVIRIYLERRQPGEKFWEYIRRHTVEELRDQADAESVVEPG